MRTLERTRDGVPVIEMMHEEPVRTRGLQRVFGVLRIAMGWTFLWAFLDKAFGLGFSTGRNAETGAIVFGGPDGKMHECAGVYQEVVPNRKLAFTWHWPNSTPERVSVVTIVFEAVGGGTQLHFRHDQFHDEAARDGHKRGWTGAFENLGRYLESA